MYCSPNFKTKKALKEAIKNGEQVIIFAPGFGTPNRDGQEFLEGPHYPEPHKWYAGVEVRNGIIIKVS